MRNMYYKPTFSVGLTTLVLKLFYVLKKLVIIIGVHSNEKLESSMVGFTRTADTHGPVWMSMLRRKKFDVWSKSKSEAELESSEK